MLYKYYISQTVIVRNVTLRNMIINRGEAGFDDHIPNGDISDYYTSLEIPIQNSHRPEGAILYYCPEGDSKENCHMRKAYARTVRFCQKT